MLGIHYLRHRKMEHCSSTLIKLHYSPIQVFIVFTTAANAYIISLITDIKRCTLLTSYAPYVAITSLLPHTAKSGTKASTSINPSIIHMIKDRVRYYLRS